MPWISTCREALGATEENPTALLMIDATPEQSYGAERF
jgi:hypothetical protein